MANRLNFMAGSTLYQSRIVIKKPKKKRKAGLPDAVERLHEKWFFDLEPAYYVELQKEWNEVNLKIEIKMQKNYDAWLNYFKTLPPSHIQLLATTGKDFLTTEAYAALSRWHDIITNPHRIEKIHQSGLTEPTGKNKNSIVAMALKNDRYGVLKATRDRIAEKLEKGAGSRDTALLAREMTEVMTQIAEYERRAGPKKSTKLGQLMSDMPSAKRSRSAGTRRTSFKSRVTIKDVEND